MLTALAALLVPVGVALVVTALPQIVVPTTPDECRRLLAEALALPAAVLARSVVLGPIIGALEPAAQRVAVGRGTPWSAAIWVTFALLTGGICGTAVAVIAGVLPGILMAVIAAAVPIAVLLRQARELEEQLELEVPEWLDGLALIVSAGTDFRTAMLRYTQTSSQTALTPLLRAFQADVQAGMRNVEALERFAVALQIPRFDGLFLSLRTALLSGLPLAESLRRHAEDERRRRFEIAEKRAAQTAVRLTGPLLLVFAALLLLLVGPLMLVSSGVGA